MVFPSVSIKRRGMMCSCVGGDGYYSVVKGVLKMEQIVRWAVERVLELEGGVTSQKKKRTRL
jgi:hypothetical protein